MSSSAGTGVQDEVHDKFQELLSGRGGPKWQVYRLSDSSFQAHDVIFEKEMFRNEINTTGEWSMEDELNAWYAMIKHMKRAKIRTRRGKVIPGPRYAVFDFEYEVGAGEGLRKKVALIDWCPDNMDIYWRTIHPASLASLKTSLSISTTLQIKDDEQILYKHALGEIDKKADTSSLPVVLPDLRVEEDEGAAS